MAPNTPSPTAPWWLAIDIIDDCTRTGVACHVTARETSAAAIAALTATEFGAPGLVLADHGSAFTGGAGGGHGPSRPGRFAAAVTDLAPG
jgi:hypothetical protein